MYKHRLTCPLEEKQNANICTFNEYPVIFAFSKTIWKTQ